jgi:ankyrin repeat protein
MKYQFLLFMILLPISLFMPAIASEELYWAILTNKINIAEDILNRDASLANTSFKSGNSPLTIAMLFDEDEMAIMLLNHGAIRQPDQYGNTLLHYAAYSSGEKLMRLMLQKFPHLVNQPNHSGYTPLHGAAFEARESIVQLLIEHGAQTNMKDINGDTPLHYAAMRAALPVVELLLKNGALPNLRDNLEIEPYFYVEKKYRGYKPKNGLRKKTAQVLMEAVKKHSVIQESR